MSKENRIVGEISRGPKPHEALARAGIEALLDDDAHAQLEAAFPARDVRVDMVVHGDALAGALSPVLAKAVSSRKVLLEFQSKPLRLARLRLMSVALHHAYAQHANGDGWTPPRGEPSKPPIVLAMVPSMTKALRKMAASTPDAGVYVMRPMGLSIYLLDNSRVPSDSRYCHLKWLHAPKAGTREALEAAIVRQMDESRAHSRLSRSKLETLFMSSIKSIFSDGERRDLSDLEEIGFIGMYDRGVEQGRLQGRQQGIEQGRLQGRQQGIEQGRLQGRQQGIEQGRLQGAEQGRLRALRGSILDLAEARDISLSPESQHRLDACTDVDQLKSWLLWVGTGDVSSTELPR